MSDVFKTTTMSNELLLNALNPLKVYYENKDVEEIAINRPEEICIKYIGKNWATQPAPEVSVRGIFSLCRMLANVTDQDFDVNQLPILSATLPGGHRFQAIIGPNVRYDMGDTHGIALCIRRFNADKKFLLDDFKLTKEIKREELNAHRGLDKHRYSDYVYEDLISAISNGEAVLISGATSTGKTTFLNALVEFIPRDRRIITVEDTREVVVPHDNRVHLVVSRTSGTNKVSYSHVLDSVVRMTPDIIICGEVSVTNSKSIYRLMTTGHSNFMATIHAESPEMALRAFWQNLTQENPNLDAEAVIEILSRSFGRIVQIDRSSGQRVISAVDAPNIIEKTIRSEAKAQASNKAGNAATTPVSV